MPFTPPRIGMSQPLHLQGICLDSIVDGASLYNSIESGERKSWIAVALRLNTAYCTGQGRTEVLWRTLLADVTSESHPAPETYGGRFSPFLFIRAIMVRDYKLLASFFLYEDDFPGHDVFLETLHFMDVLHTVDPDGVVPSLARVHAIISKIDKGKIPEVSDFAKSASRFAGEIR
jgi:hypothetical protein